MSQFAVESFAGLVAGIAIVFAIAIMGLARDRGIYPTILMAIATYYVIFAVDVGDTSAILFNGVVAAIFALVAMYGYKRSLWIVSGGLIAHGIFDLIYAQFESNPAPSWWPVFCAVIDIVLGVALAYWILKNSKEAKSGR